MSDKFLNLSDAERREALGVAASNSGRPAHLLEKDVWVVWCLNALFSSALGEHLVFKGGTSLHWSKAVRDVPDAAQLHETVYERLAMKSVRNYTSFGPYRPAALQEHQKAKAFFEPSSDENKSSPAEMKSAPSNTLPP